MNNATSDLLHRRVSKMGNLPVMPTVLKSLSETLSGNTAEANVEKVVETISYDKSLTAQCLRVANSAMFRRRSEVNSIKGAVIALGLVRIRDIVYSCALPSLMVGAKHGMAPVTFWRHALGTALVSQHLAQKLGISNPEKFYLAGLLHDIGILVNSLLFHDEFQSVLRNAEDSEAPLVEVELKTFGFTHCETGRILADLWKLPEDIAATIEFHHHPSLENSDIEMSCVVYLADLLCRLRGLGYGYYEAREFDLASEEPWLILQRKYPSVQELDLARFTFELDEHALAVQELVDSIFADGKTQA